MGTEWSWRGEDAALQLDVQSGVVESQEYPNAFERIAGALDATNSGDVGPPRHLAVSLSSPAESRTSAVGHTARFTPSILSAPS